MIGLLAELQRRRVFRVAGLYAAASWLLAQVADVGFGAYELPPGALRALIGVLILGFPIALAASWVFDLTPLGIRRAEPVDPCTIPLRARAIDYTVLTIAVILVGGLGYRLWRSNFELLETPATGEAPSRSAAVETRPAVAVLGFRNSSGREDAAWLSIALGEMLTTELGAGGRVRTVPGERVANMKIDLDLPASDSYAPDTLARMRGYLGADLVVFGSYAAVGEPSQRRVRLDVRLQDARSGETIALAEDTGEEIALFELVARVGGRLRQGLGVEELSESEVAAVRASEPASPETARLYAEGLAALRAFDALNARDLLTQAAASAPASPLIRRALADAWEALGHTARAKVEAQAAFDASSALGREERLFVEGRLYESNSDWARAIERYRALFTFFPDNVDYGLRLATAQRKGGEFPASIATLSRLRELAPGSGPEAAIDVAAAQAYALLTDFEAAGAAAARAVERGTALGMRLVVASAKLEEGWALSNLNERERARSTLAEARGMFAEAGNQGGAVRAAIMIAILETQVGEHAAARARFEEAIALARSIGNEQQLAFALNNLANLTQDEGNFAEARGLYEQALESNRRAGAESGIAGTLGNLANLAQYAGEFDEARRLHEESLTLYRRLGARLNVAIELNNIGELLIEQGDLAGARRALEEALALKRELGTKKSIAYALDALAELLLLTDDLPGSRAMAEEAIAIRGEVGEAPLVAMSRLIVAEVVLEEGNAAEAAGSAAELAATFRTQPDDEQEVEALLLLARAQLALGSTAQARETVDRVATLVGGVERVSLRLRIPLVTAIVRAREGDTEGALAALDQVESDATRTGLPGISLEARLASAGLEAAVPRARGAALRPGDLAEEAEARGFLLIARKARSLDQPSPPRGGAEPLRSYPPVAVDSRIVTRRTP